MERRTAIGVLAGALTLGVGGWALGTHPTGFDEDEHVTVETLEAPGSTADTWELPSDRPLVLTFFATWCGSCSRQMGTLTDAERRVGDEVPFLSVTSELVGRSVSRDDVVEWWRDHDGAWTVGLDDGGELAERFDVAGLPTVAVVDEVGDVTWSTAGTLDADRIVDEARSVASR